MGLRAIADADPDGVCQRLLDECDFETTTEAELEALVREQLALLEVGDPGCAWCLSGAVPPACRANPEWTYG